MGSRSVLAWVVVVALCWGPMGCGDDGGSLGGGDGGHANDATGGGFGGDDGGRGVTGGGGVTDASLSPSVFGNTGGTPGSCLGLGAGCSTAGDCCSDDCAAGVCDYPACTSDHEACVANGNCCSQSCVGGMCAPLNTTCKTLGNQCASGAECCSQLCSNGTCQASSFCGQAGDACSNGSDCCTGTCNLASGATLGTCDTSPPGGPANCGVVDGQLCGGTAPDGGVVTNDAGLPACGGPCCSRACAPWGPTGALVCQPASGCHVVGDLCTADSDCCGSAGLPGGSGKPVTCVITAPSTLGICRNPMGCKPDGDVCKLKTMSCNSSCDCCSGNCETEDTCKQDNVGVPRCAPAAVRRRGRRMRVERELLRRDAVRPQRRAEERLPTYAPAAPASLRAARAPTTPIAVPARRASSAWEVRTASAVPAVPAAAMGDPGATAAMGGPACPTTAATKARMAGRPPGPRAPSTGSSVRARRNVATACRATGAASIRSPVSRRVAFSSPA